MHGSWLSILAASSKASLSWKQSLNAVDASCDLLVQDQLNQKRDNLFTNLKASASGSQMVLELAEASIWHLDVGHGFSISYGKAVFVDC